MDGRWRIREKSYRTGGITLKRPIVASDLKPGGFGDVPMAQNRGHEQGFGKGLNDPKIALDSPYENSFVRSENSLALDIRQGSSEKTNGTAIQLAMEEEALREKEIRHPSPSVIAKLMGLDTLPPRREVHSQQREMRSITHKTSSTGLEEKHISRESHFPKVKAEDHQEFRDVFEVMEPVKVEKHHKPVRKGLQNSKASEADMVFIKQNFMGAKHFPADATLQNAKDEVNDAMEILDSKKDLFLKFLEEPNSLFSKHLQDLKYARPTCAASDITVLKSSKGGTRDITDVQLRSERKAKKFYHVPKDFLGSLEKPAANLISHSLQEHGCSVSQRLSKSHYGEAFESYLDPTQIVVLKPSLEKFGYTERDIILPRSPDYFKFGYRRHKASRSSRIQELYAERKDRQKFDSEEIIGNNSKSSREIAREITKQMKYSVQNSKGMVFSSKLNRTRRDEVSYSISETVNLNGSKASEKDFDDFHDWHSRSRPSTSYSTESSVSMEARKHLSQRWKMIRRSEEVGLVGKGSLTLAEMLAHSYIETPSNTPRSLHIQRASVEKLAREAVLARCRDIQKDGRFINSPRPVAFPSSSPLHHSPKPSCERRVYGDDYGCKFRCMSNDVHNLGPDNSLDGYTTCGTCFHIKSKSGGSRPRLFSSDGLKNKPSAGLTIITPLDYKNRIDAIGMAKEKPMLPEVSNDSVVHAEKLCENSSAPRFKDARLPVLSTDHVEQEMAVLEVAKDGELLTDQNNTVLKVQGSSFARPRLAAPQSNCDGRKSDLGRSKELEQQSPVSVLESPSEDESYGLEGFERLNVDLHELRMQLQLLKLGSEDSEAEESEVLVSSEDNTGGEQQQHLNPVEEMLQAFRDDEDRDFSYMLDILICSGVHCTNQGKIFDAYHSAENLVSPGVFEKLEKRYSSLDAWSLSERKLLFDLINSILADILVSHMDLHPWIVKSKSSFSCKFVREELVEEVWQIVVRLRKEMAIGNPEDKVLDLKWLDLGNDIDMLGKEIEEMLLEEILEELKSDFIGG